MAERHVMIIGERIGRMLIDVECVVIAVYHAVRCRAVHRMSHHGLICRNYCPGGL